MRSRYWGVIPEHTTPSLTKFYTHFFNTRRTLSRLMASNPAFDFIVSVSSRTAQCLQALGPGPQANAASSASRTIVYLTGCPGLASSLVADSASCSNKRFFVRQTVILSTWKKNFDFWGLFCLFKAIAKYWWDYASLSSNSYFFSEQKSYFFLFNLIGVAICTIF